MLLLLTMIPALLCLRVRAWFAMIINKHATVSSTMTTAKECVTLPSNLSDGQEGLGGGVHHTTAT